jgi:hypothetical protein
MSETIPTCSCCKDIRKARGLKPKGMVSIRPAAKRGTPVFVCEDCDGPVAEIAATREDD